MTLKSTLAAAVLSLFCAQAAVAQTSVQIGNPGPGIHGIPVLLAIDELKKRGVKATLEDFNGGGTQIIQSLACW